MMIIYNFFLINLCFYLISCEDVCYKDTCKDDLQAEFRFLFYDINPPEGFNLRRDVYMRMAILVHNMQQSTNSVLNSFKLVLAPWSHLIHWTYNEIPEYLPWAKFFDISSLKSFAPVIELHEYFNYIKNSEDSNSMIIDNVFILQHFEEMFRTGKFEDKWEIAKCQKQTKLRYFHYSNITSSNATCLSFHGSANKLTGLFSTIKAKTILLEHAEVVLHDSFGTKIYWEARRSMRFNKELRKIAAEFRELYLNSTDKSDNTFLEPNWKNDKPKRTAKGGPYLSVHLRRRDFISNRKNDTISLTSVARQILIQLRRFNLKKVFLATDTTDREIQELESYIPLKVAEVHRYLPRKDIKQQYHEAGIAIIDQIICSYARYFIGTSDSTFTFRIQEEREILGFPTDSTFNVLCKGENDYCQMPSAWKIVY